MIFVDTSYLIATAVRHDALHDAATAWSEKLSGPFVTTDYVLLEFVNSLSAPRQRAKAHAYLVALRHNPHVRVVASEAELFKQGLELHARRLDKSWSLTDCISFVVMQRTKAVDALTYDQHFEQAGFRALLRHPPPAGTDESAP